MKNDFNDNAIASFDGHVLVTDLSTGEVLLDKHNAINYINVAVAVAGLFSGTADAETGLGYGITKIAYGNGGTVIDETGNVEYRSTRTDRVTSINEDGEPPLHSLVHIKSVANVDEENKIELQTYVNDTKADIVVTSTLDYDEQFSETSATQDPLDDTESMSSDYTIDEISLITDSGLGLSHLTFHPIQKSANRKIQVVYTIRITAGG